MAEVFSVLVHPFPSPTPNSCAYEQQCGKAAPQNAVLFIGGLGDGPHTIPYVRSLAEQLEKSTDLNYSIFEFRMTSSFGGFGTSSLKQDVRDISSLVEYLRSIGRRKIVLFGHSTGCQDCVAYAEYAKKEGAPVDGFILQGSVSDREAIALSMDDAAMKRSLQVASELLAEPPGNSLMPWAALPPSWDSPITASRWYSLASVGGDDDFFSADFSDEQTKNVWQRFEQPVLILYSGAEEYAPAGVDLSSLIHGWIMSCRPGIASDLSGLIPEASHNVEKPEARRWLSERTALFLESLE